MNQTGEEWKDVKGYEGFYQVSNMGRVRSLDRCVYQKSSHDSMMQKCYKGQMLHPFDNGAGYKVAPLRKGNDKKKNHYVHRLVAEAFIPNPYEYKEINHKDYDKSNNTVGNLEWVTRQMNVIYSVEHMRKPRINCKPTSSGEKYIHIHQGKYRFQIWRRKGLRISRKYNSLEEAVAAREVVLNGEKHLAG